MDVLVVMPLLLGAAGIPMDAATMAVISEIYATGRFDGILFLPTFHGYWKSLFPFAKVFTVAVGNTDGIVPAVPALERAMEKFADDIGEGCLFTVLCHDHGTVVQIAPLVGTNGDVCYTTIHDTDRADDTHFHRISLGNEGSDGDICNYFVAALAKYGYPTKERISSKPC
jgi:hypothetical protein